MLPASALPGTHVLRAGPAEDDVVFRRHRRTAVEHGWICFFPDGSSTGGEVTLASSKALRYVQVDWLTGRVAVYEDSAP